MRVFQIIASAQGAHIFSNMGQAFGIRRRIDGANRSVFRSTDHKNHREAGSNARRFDLGARISWFAPLRPVPGRPQDLGHAQIAEEGQRIFNYLFVRKERRQKIIENRAKVLPIDPVTLEKLFPFIAVMAIAAIELRTRRPLGLILYRVMKGAADDRAIANRFLRSCNI